jgi:hypothetical protein
MTENFRQNIFLIQNDELNDRSRIISPVEGVHNSYINRDKHPRKCNSPLY